MRNILNEYKDLADFLKTSLGNLYDVFVFEFENDELKLVESDYVDRSNIEIYLPFVQSAIKKKKRIINKAIEMPHKKLDKLSIQIITDDNHDVIGAFCVSMKCSPFLKLEGLANEFLNIKTSFDEDNEFYPSTLDGIEKFIDDYNIVSSKPTKAEKTDIIFDLYDIGMFNIKGAVAKVADMLNMSTKSVYRYISKIKEARE